MLQHHTVEHSFCLNANLNGKSIAMKYLKKVNTDCQYLYRKNKFLNAELCRVLCESLI